jgi:hypothetical protein
MLLVVSAEYFHRTQIVQSFHQKTEEVVVLPNAFYKVSIILISKTTRNTTKMKEEKKEEKEKKTRKNKESNLSHEHWSKNL